jgi:hypothetical protein
MLLRVEWSEALVATAALVAFGCSASARDPERVAGVKASSSAAPASAAGPKVYTSKSFTFPIPDGYTAMDLVGIPPEKRMVAFEAKETVMGYQPSIVFQRVPIYGGTMGDAKLCTQTGESTAEGVNGKLTTAALIDGPGGKVCQFRIVGPEEVGLITELISPTDTWLMTCNHANGDAAAEKVCRATLADFRFIPESKEAAASSPCEHFLRHVEDLTGNHVRGPSDRGSCETLSDEQRECGLSATSEDELGFCLNFNDPTRRATGRQLAPSVRASWPGSVLQGVLDRGAVGCAFAGLSGGDGMPLGDSEVVALFATRAEGNKGAAVIVMAWLQREAASGPWGCTRTYPPDLCESLRRTCGARK